MKPDPLVLEVRIAIRNKERYTGGGFELSESHEIGTDTFLEAAAILGKFHELTETFKKAQS